ncbi:MULTISPECIES: proline racemase family protein [unclassified Pseudoalteromonas]|uniref:proline racemase family protein n=1 Tax=unclassified Pseudoalteromonas TaxID=194690 RepID=UPI0025B46689|nr:MULTISPECIES: proline racemase family protein [unclassified Pseudoalteromonas]MDN3380335.1 proline racemase family protein [Pseudoalteromonas sp. APC 3893]MDN3388668.1 proline racemase family protein [Pseudoalteromonas sp. APC 4017]
MTNCLYSHWQQPKNDWLAINTLDMHTGGEPLRIIIDGFSNLQGQTMLEKRADCLARFDHLRKALMFEPRGHADMYGAVITEPEHKDSHFGVLFLHNEGYSTMCGHAIIALATAAKDCSISHFIDGVNELRIDTPAGLIKAYITLKDKQLTNVCFDNVASYAPKLDMHIELPMFGAVSCDIAYGGAYYAFVDADTIDLSLAPNNHEQIISLGKAIKQKINGQYQPTHPTDDALSFLYGVIFYSNSQTSHSSFSRHVCIFAEGELDRSPTGTGVSARAALEFAKGRLAIGQRIKIESILGSVFTVELKAQCLLADINAVVPRVSGEAFVTGKHTFLIDPDDPLKQGFIFR